MGKIDLAMKEVFKQPAYFADICNCMFFHGQDIIQPEHLHSLDPDSEVAPSKKDSSGKSFGRHRDVLKEVIFSNTGEETEDSSGEPYYMETDSAAYAMIGIENQSEIHSAMPARVMLYDSMQYAVQIQEQAEQSRLKKQGTNQDTHSSSAEFLSGFPLSGQLKPVVTIVVYTGASPWTHPMQLTDILKTDGIPTEVRESITNCRLLILDVRHSDQIQLLNSPLGTAFRAVQLQEDSDGLLQYIREHEAVFTHFPPLLGNMMQQLMNFTLPEQAEQKEEFDMCYAIEVWKQQWMQEGLSEGLLEGALEKTRSIIRNLILWNLDDSQICQIAECSQELVDEVRKTMAQIH